MAFFHPARSAPAESWLKKREIPHINPMLQSKEIHWNNTCTNTYFLLLPIMCISR